MTLDEPDDDFAVWPFRRELVDPFARVETLPPPVACPAPVTIRVQAPRRPASPLRIALPAAVAAFVFAAAGTAALAGSHERPSPPPAAAQAR